MGNFALNVSDVSLKLLRNFDTRSYVRISDLLSSLGYCLNYLKLVRMAQMGLRELGILEGAVLKRSLSSAATLGSRPTSAPEYEFGAIGGGSGDQMSWGADA